MADEIIIVDELGNEHHFPAGMDPKRAAQIVRNANLKVANDRPLKEPTDYWGGFRKGFDDHLTEVGNAMFEGAAHPKTAGDIAGLMLPTTMGMGTPSILGLKAVSEAEPVGNKAVRGAARLGAEALDLTPNIIQSKAEEKVIKGLRSFGKQPEPRWLDRYKPNKGGVPDQGVPQEDLPQSTAATVDPYMPNQSGVPDRGIPQGDLPAGNHVEVESALDSATRQSAAHSPSPTVAHRESAPYGGVEVPHKVKKPRTATQVANPYGKDDATYREILKRMGKEILPDEAGTIGAGPIADEVGGGASALDSGDASSLEGVDIPAPDKPKLSATDLATELRRHYGSRDAGRMLFPNQSTSESAAAIKRLAPGPSRTPIVAEERIRAAMNKAKGDDDPILKLLVAGLSGKMLASSALDQQE